MSTDCRSIIRMAVAFALPLLFFLSACGGGADRKMAKPAAKNPDGSIALPAIPANLTTTGQRADYLALHYWDNLDFADTQLSLDTAFMEQSFVNYVTILPYASEKSRNDAISAILSRAARENRKARDFLLYVAERYLYDPESPVYNDALYKPFAAYMLTIGNSPVAHEACREILRDIERNAPGSKAPSFSYTDRNGTMRNFSPQDVPLTVLMFYDPDCEHCVEAVSYLSRSEKLRNAISDKKLRLIAVYPGDDAVLWRKHASMLPEEWEVGIDKEGKIDGEELYQVRSTPSFYVVSADGIIQLKDQPLRTVVSVLGI